MYQLDFSTLPGIVALVILGFILVQLFLSLIFGEFDIDFDGDGFGDFDMSSIVSPKGMLHFLLGFSWYLVLVQPIRENCWLWYDWIIAPIIGFAIFVLMALFYYYISKMACEKHIESGNELIGRTGKIYLKYGQWNYDISIIISGTERNLSVVSKEKIHYAIGATVEIIEYKEGTYFIK